MFTDVYPPARPRRSLMPASSCMTHKASRTHGRRVACVTPCPCAVYAPINIERVGAICSSLSRERFCGTVCLRHSVSKDAHAWSRSSCLPLATALSSVRSFRALCLQGSLVLLGWTAAADDVVAVAYAPRCVPLLLWPSRWPHNLAATARWHGTPWDVRVRDQQSSRPWTLSRGVQSGSMPDANDRCTAPPIP
eukprot:6492317-Amphidinium_carterae.2